MEKIRHKIAHNNLFTLVDQENSKKLVSNLIQTIKLANEQIDKVSFNEEDKQTIMSSFIEFKKITADIFTEELRRSIKWAIS